MNAKQKLHQAHLREWAACFTDQKTSGLTVRAWCEQNQISTHNYNYWKHIPKEGVVDQALPEIVPLSLPASFTSSAPATLQTVVQDHTMANRADRVIRTNCTNTNVRLCIDGVSIEIEPSVSEEFLRTLVRAVHYA